MRDGGALHRAGHDVIVFERSESGLVSRGAGILMLTTSWQDITARGILDGTVPACRADCSRFVTGGRKRLRKSRGVPQSQPKTSLGSSRKMPKVTCLRCRTRAPRRRHLAR